eukprot:SAG11_NODE_658_length_7897_cov_13.075789_4_plen_106_part_00
MQQHISVMSNNRTTLKCRTEQKYAECPSIDPSIFVKSKSANVAAATSCKQSVHVLVRVHVSFALRAMVVTEGELEGGCDDGEAEDGSISCIDKVNHGGCAKFHIP